MVVTLREPTIPITEIEQSAFCQTDEELKSKSLLEEFKVDVRWQKLPVSYMRMEPEDLDRRILEARAALSPLACPSSWVSRYTIQEEEGFFSLSFPS